LFTTKTKNKEIERRKSIVNITGRVFPICGSSQALATSLKWMSKHLTLSEQCLWPKILVESVTTSPPVADRQTLECGLNQQEFNTSR